MDIKIEHYDKNTPDATFTDIERVEMSPMYLRVYVNKDYRETIPKDTVKGFVIE